MTIEHQSNDHIEELNEQLFVTCEEGNLEAVEDLIERGSNINARNDIKWTPLHAAIYYKHQGVATYLIQHGADVNTADKNGDTPLFMLHHDMVPIARMLLERGARIDVRNDDEFTPLDMAISDSNVAIAKILITEYNANINDPITGECLLLERTILEQDEDVLKILIELDAHLDTTLTVTLEDGTTTPLYVAALEVLCNHDSPDDENMCFVKKILRALRNLDRHSENSQLEKMISECANNIIEAISQAKSVETLVTTFLSDTRGASTKPATHSSKIWELEHKSVQSEDEDDVTQEEDDVIIGSKRPEREDEDDAIPEAKISRLVEKQPAPSPAPYFLVPVEEQPMPLLNLTLTDAEFELLLGQTE